MDKEATNVVLFQELLGVVVTVDVNLGDSVENSRVLATCLHTSLKPRKNQFQPVALFNFVDKLVNGEVASDRSKQSLDGGLVTVNIQQTPNYLRCPNWVDTLDIDLDELGQVVLVQVQDEIMDKVETIANNNERELVGQLGLLQEVLNLLRIVVVALSADTFNFSDLTGSRCSLDVLEVNLRVSAEVDDGSQVVVETLEIDE
jgi:hypothetical protein